AGFEALGVDTDAAAVEAGRAEGRNLDAGTVAEILGRFDVITLSHLLEHLRAPEPFLAVLRERLKPGGRRFVWAPNYAGLLPRLLPMLWYGWQPRQHYRHYTPRTLRRLVEEAGFVVENVSTGSMDHSFPRQPRWQDTIKYAICRLIAGLGGRIG